MEQQKLAKSGIADIDRMDGRTFEKYLKVLFEKLGYEVERTRYIGDYGADLVTTNNGVKTVIQAKRYKCRMVSDQQNLTEAIEIKAHPEKSWPSKQNAAERPPTIDIFGGQASCIHPSPRLAGLWRTGSAAYSVFL